MIITTLTKVIYLGNGTTREFPIPFTYSAAETVKVGIYDPNTDKTVILTRGYYVDKVRNAVFYPGYPPGEAPAESEQPGPLPAGKKAGRLPGNAADAGDRFRDEVPAAGD